MITLFRKIRSIQVKLLFGTLPTVIFAFIVMAVVITFSAQSAIDSEVDQKVEKQVKNAIAEVSQHLQSHQRIPIGLAKTVEALGITTESQNGLRELVKKMPATNPDTFGSGIFMGAPINGAYYCPYAYKDGSNIAYTDDYALDNTTQGWYVIGNTDKDVAWSDVYYDPTLKITMITATSPIRDASGSLIGVATSDMDFTNVQKMISNIQVGKKGYAILMTKDGTFLGKGKEEIKPDDKGVFPSIGKDDNPSLVKLGTEVLEKKQGTGNFEEAGIQYKAFYSEMPETGWIVLMAIPEKEITDPISAILMKVVVVTVIALTVLLGLLIIVARSITSPLRPLKSEIDAISKGDFTRTIETHSVDEIGQIAVSMNQMVGALRATMQEVTKSSAHVAETAEELEASASQNGQAVEQVAVAATEISGSNMEIAKVTSALEHLIVEMTTRAGQIEAQMSTVTEALTQVDHMSADSGKSVVDLVQTMRGIFEDINLMSTLMGNLSEQSNQINTIIETIQGIASQTNLLALNASIEAARAGEAGRGFAVVADEIRKLAEQSSDSANNISEIVTEIRRATIEANTSTKGVVQSISVGYEDLQKVGSAFDMITGNISNIGSLIHEADHMAKVISDQSEKASRSASELTHLTNKSAEEATSIAAATEEQLASVEEQTAATTGLAHIAEELQEKMSIFKV